MADPAKRLVVKPSDFDLHMAKIRMRRYKMHKILDQIVELVELLYDNIHFLEPVKSTAAVGAMCMGQRGSSLSPMKKMNKEKINRLLKGKTLKSLQ